MANPDSLFALIAILLACAWASGLNLYAVLLVLGIAGFTETIQLPQSLEILQNPLVIFLAGFMYIVEFGVDKIPGVDSTWDLLHTFIRIPAGALLAGAFMADVDIDWVPAAYILGGILAFASHATKSSARLLINTSPEPFTNWAASISEDVLVLLGLWLAFSHPIVFLLLLLGFIALIIWLVPKMLQLIGTIISRIVGWFRREQDRQTNY